MVKDDAKSAVIEFITELTADEQQTLFESAARSGLMCKVVNNVEREPRFTTFGFAGAFLILFFVAIVYLVFVVYGELARFRSHSHEMQDCFISYLKYRFDYWYAWTPGSAVIVLCFLSTSLLAFGCIVQAIALRESLTKALWNVWVWTVDPNGGQAVDDDGSSIGIVVSCGGMLIFAMLMSIVSNGFESCLRGMRQGLRPVVESGHIVILGWSPIVPVVIEELCCAGASRGGSVIAILSPLPKPQVEQIIKRLGKKLQNSVVVVRSGYPYLAESLAQVSVQFARTVVVVSDAQLMREQADSQTLNVLLALRSEEWPRAGTLVVQCELSRNQALFHRLSPGMVEVLTTNDFLGKLMVQCSRQYGLSQVAHCITSFKGHEIYIARAKGLQGMAFGDALHALPGAVPLGFVDQSGHPNLLPPMEMLLQGHEDLILVAEDISTLPIAASADLISDAKFKCSKLIQRSQHSPVTFMIPEKQKVVILGWSEIVGEVLVELDEIAGMDSEVIIYSPCPKEERIEFLDALECRQKHQCRNLAIAHHEGPLGARHGLEKLPLSCSSKIFVIADKMSSSPSEADLQTAAVLLQVHDILEEQNTDNKCVKPVIIPQILQHATQRACFHLGLPDFIDSNSLAAQIIANVCEKPDVGVILSTLLSESGPHFCIRSLEEYPAALGSEGLAEYVAAGGRLSFNDITVVASLAGEIVIGWTPETHDNHQQFELNPKYRFRERHWAYDDRIIALIPPRALSGLDIQHTATISGERISKRRRIDKLRA